MNGFNAQQVLLSKSSRPTPSTSPFRPAATSVAEVSSPLLTPSSSSAALLSRLRAGSMPQRPLVLGSSSPFSNSVFSGGNWSSGRERGSTLASIKSQEDTNSPTQSAFSKEGLTDSDVKTLDYLGLVETPRQSRANLARPTLNEAIPQHQTHSASQLLDYNALTRNANRFRSYSVNAATKYDDDDDKGAPYSGLPSGMLTPSSAALDAQLAATQAQIHQHNLAVQAFANHASANRPRARTAGILDTPPQRTSLRNYLVTPSRLDNSVTASQLSMEGDRDYDNLADSVRMLQMARGNPETVPGSMEDDSALASRSLWIGSIPNSTTVSSLDAIFGVYGPIESTRILTHKNCGFVNFRNVTNAIQAKQVLNGKEIFPGAGSVRIGYAKAPSAVGTPRNGVQESPTGDGQPGALPNNSTVAGQGDSENKEDVNAKVSAAPMRVAELSELRSDMALLIEEFGAIDDTARKEILASVDNAIAYDRYEKQIPTTPEPSHSRVFDAPKLREIRKRADNQLCSQAEMEEVATQMLPEITELAWDYLGNTVVQKMFEHCSEGTKGQMVAQLAPHLATIGVHKNGTWAAQKIIDVCKSASQMRMIVDHLRPYTVPLFLDQYGNYVLQCCLRFGSPFNDFIFEIMMDRMCEISPGRFGARAMRASLESHHATKDQQKMLAAVIILHSTQLATNTNGALLLTWLLDTCTFPRRRTVLAPRLVSHLVHLCTHKIAYLTVLKVINQRNECEARDIILQALFFSPNDATLEQILSDPNSGVTLIFKALTTPFFDEGIRPDAVANVVRVLTKLNCPPTQAYKRLMDEVGMSSRSNQGQPQNQPALGSQDRSRRGASPSNTSGTQQSPLDRQASGNYASSLKTVALEPNQVPAQNGRADVVNGTPYNLGMGGPAATLYTPHPPMSHMPSQNFPPTTPYFGTPPRSNLMSAGPLPNGYASYATPPMSMDSIGYRVSPQTHSSPLSGPTHMGSPVGYGQQGQSPLAGATMYGNTAVGSNIGAIPPHGYMSAHQLQPVVGGSSGGGGGGGGSGKRGRVNHA